LVFAFNVSEEFLSAGVGHELGLRECAKGFIGCECVLEGAEEEDSGLEHLS
jgi:hypothetical protein